MMIRDPCNSSLRPGIYGSQMGLLARLKSRFSFSSNFSGANNGYVVWYPQYSNDRHDTGTSQQPVNLFNFGAGNADTTPTLTNFGNSNTVATAQSIQDPAFPFVSGDVVMDFRVIAACIRVTYVGATSDAQGMIYPLTNIPEEVLTRGGSDKNPAACSTLATYATDGVRASDVLEIVYRPGNIPSWSNSINAPMLSGSTTASPVLSTVGGTLGNTGIGFVIINGRPMNEYIIECYKVIEWRPEPISGFPVIKQKGVDNPSILAKSLSYLDLVMPDWQTRVFSAVGSAATSVIRDAVLGGAGSRMSQRLGNGDL